jgi:hypothetical protein
MSDRNRDRSYCKIVTIPKLHDDTEPAEVWFEAGAIHFRNATNPEEVNTASVEEFEARIEAVAGYIEDDYFCGKFVCGKQAARRALFNLRELIKEAKKQLHVGMPVSVIAEEERSRKPTKMRSYFGDSVSQASRMGGFTKRQSGLIVPQ